MNPLVPCPSCSRHVRASETACPFCASELSLRVARAVPAAPRRLERLAVFTFAAAVAVTGCTVNPTEDTSEQESELGGIQPMYGQPPPPDVDLDAGPAPDIDAGEDSGDQDAGSPCDTPPADDGGIHAMYGAPAFEEIWTPCPVDEEDGGGIQPMYGMPAPEN
jgi:hypothetical protein